MSGGRLVDGRLEISEVGRENEVGFIVEKWLALFVRTSPWIASGGVCINIA